MSGAALGNGGGWPATEKAQWNRVHTGLRNKSVGAIRARAAAGRQPSMFGRTEFPLPWNYPVDAADGCRKIGRPRILD